MNDGPQLTERAAPLLTSATNTVMSARGVSVFYGDKRAIKDVSLDIGRNQVLALIGAQTGRRTAARARRHRLSETDAVSALNL